MADTTFPNTDDVMTEDLLRRMWKHASGARDYVADAAGYKVTTTANALEVSVAPGEAYVNGTFVKRDVATTLSSLPTNSTVYVYVGYDDTAQNVVTVRHTTVKSTSAAEILVAEVVTGASAITSVTDKRNLVASSGWGPTE